MILLSTNHYSNLTLIESDVNSEKCKGYQEALPNVKNLSTVGGQSANIPLQNN